MRALIALLLAFALIARAELPAKFDPSRDAAKDVAAAVAKAKAAGKRVIVDVGGEWCVWCHILDGFIEANPDVRSLLDAKYVWVKVNWSPQNKNEALLSKWPAIKGYPHLFVLDGDGKLVHSQDTDVLEQGRGYSRERVTEFLRKWAPAQRAAAALK